jgi:uncharacterized protein
MLYPGSRFRMADELLENYIRQLIEAHQTPEVTIAWQGGEPTLMGLEFFKRSIEIAQKYTRPGMTIQHTIQTNGVDRRRVGGVLQGTQLPVGIASTAGRCTTYRQDKAARPPSIK